MPRGSHRVVSAGVRCSFESGHKQDDHALTLRAKAAVSNRSEVSPYSITSSARDRNREKDGLFDDSR